MAPSMHRVVADDDVRAVAWLLFRTLFQGQVIADICVVAGSAFLEISLVIHKFLFLNMRGQRRLLASKAWFENQRKRPQPQRAVGRNVLRRISTFGFYSLARQTRSLNYIDWACKIHRRRSRLLGIAETWRNRNFRRRHPLNIRRTNLREQMFVSALPVSSQAPRP